MRAPAGKARTGELRLQGWSRHRRIVILRRRTERSLALDERDADGQLRLGFAEIDDGREVWEYAVLVTSLTARFSPSASSIATAPIARTASTS